VTDPAGQLRGPAGAVLGRPLGDLEADHLDKYLNLLVKWQNAQRLVGSTDRNWLIDNVVVDSLLFLRVLPDAIKSVCDVGSGAGIPGVPLQIVRPDIAMTLLEARARRVSFLSAVVRELALPGCRVVHRRLEEMGDEFRGRFDAVVMRCAGDLSQMIASVERLVSPGGVVVVSGPPTPIPIEMGEWISVQGPRRPRLFWRLRVA
jgi:16S rRNA (guanine527-N7)-methyltransferase